MNMTDVFKMFQGARSEQGGIRISNWLHLLRSKETTISFYYDQKKHMAFLREVNKHEAGFVVQGLQAGGERTVFLTVEIMNRYYLAEVSLLRRENELYVTSHPQVLHYVSRRLYPRLEIKNIPVYFFSIYTPVTSTRQEENSLRNYFPDLYREAVKDNPSLPVIFQILIAALKRNSEDFSMRLFIQEAKHRELVLDEREKAMVERKKTFYIKNVLHLSSYLEPLSVEYLTNLMDLYQEMLEAQGEVETLLYFEKIKKEDSDKFLLSYVLSPLFLFDEVIGYMKLQSSQFERKIFSREEARNLHYLAALFSHAISKISIRQSYYDFKKARARVVNISMSGMLIAIKNSDLFRYLKRSKRLKIKIFLRNEELELFGEIKRFFTEDDVQYLGVLFFKSRAGDMAKLEDFIYHENRGFMLLEKPQMQAYI